MQIEDIEQVVQIEKATFSDPWSYQSFVDSWNENCCIYLVAEKEKEIVAYCGLYVIQDEGQITNVAVKSTCRGEHIGTNMLNELINQAKNKGAKNFTLEVRLSNKVAIHLYEKLGFTNVGIRKRFYNNPVEDAMIMWFYN